MTECFCFNIISYIELADLKGKMLQFKETVVKIKNKFKIFLTSKRRWNFLRFHIEFNLRNALAI